MRITGGSARGISLRVAPSGVRPATDRMRAAVFSSLMQSNCVRGGRFLDLFAGSGAYGLEAWSRSATSGDFIEINPRACAIIQWNVVQVARSAGLDKENCKVWRADVRRWRPHKTEYDLIFSDPPYADSHLLLPAVFEIASASLSLNASARLVLEMPDASFQVPSQWHCERTFGKGRGDPCVAILSRAQ